MNSDQDKAIMNMGAWPALAHSSSHRLPNHNNAIFGLGEGPSNGINGRIRRRTQNDNIRIAPQPPIAVDAHMEVDEPEGPPNNNDSGSDTNHTDEEDARVGNA